jgi:hypothetical protein
MIRLLPASDPTKARTALSYWSDMVETSDYTKSARALLLEQKHGVLSTHSVAVPGYPFGSVTPYCLDRTGRPVILISRIAQHTKNIIADPRVSLTVVESADHDIQAHGRLTYLANAINITDEIEDVGERYYQYFPSSAGYHETHDFSFYRLEPVRVRFIGGFGEIYWIGPADFLRANPFTTKQERMITEHMNADHQAALKHYCRSLKNLDLDDHQSVTMVGIDGEGFDLLVGQRLHRLSFEQPVANMEEARQALVAMSKR